MIIIAVIEAPLHNVAVAEWPMGFSQEAPITYSITNPYLDLKEVYAIIATQVAYVKTVGVVVIGGMYVMRLRFYSTGFT